MNRQERRKREREIEKEMRPLKKLTEKELLKVNGIINKMAKKNADEALNLIDRSFSAVLVNRGFSFKEIEKIQDELGEYMKEDQEKLIILEKRGIDMAKLQKEVKEAIEGLIKEGRGRKEVIEETIFKFPKLSRTAASNAYGKILEELDLENAAAYILEDNKELKKEINKEDAKKVAEEVARQLEKEINKEEVKKMSKEDVKVSGIEVIEEKVIKKIKVKGNNGLYEGETGVGVALKNGEYKLAFTNTEELKKFYEEFKKVLELI